MTFKELKEKRPLRYTPIVRTRKIRKVSFVNFNELTDLNERIKAKLHRNETERYESNEAMRGIIL